MLAGWASRSIRCRGYRDRGRRHRAVTPPRPALRHCRGRNGGARPCSASHPGTCRRPNNSISAPAGLGGHRQTGPGGRRMAAHRRPGQTVGQMAGSRPPSNRSRARSSYRCGGWITIGGTRPSTRANSVTAAATSLTRTCGVPADPSPATQLSPDRANRTSDRVTARPRTVHTTSAGTPPCPGRSRPAAAASAYCLGPSKGGTARRRPSLVEVDVTLAPRSNSGGRTRAALACCTGPGRPTTATTCSRRTGGDRPAQAGSAMHAGCVDHDLGPRRTGRPVRPPSDFVSGDGQPRPGWPRPAALQPVSHLRSSVTH